MLRLETCAIIVARHFDIPLRTLRGSERRRAVSTPRLLCYVLARDFTSRSYPEIGAYFGYRDHTTILDGVRSARVKLIRDDDLRHTFNAILLTIHRDFPQNPDHALPIFISSRSR